MKCSICEKIHKLALERLPSDEHICPKEILDIFENTEEKEPSKERSKTLIVRRDETIYNQNIDNEILRSCKASNSRFKCCTIDGGEYYDCHFEWCKLHDVEKVVDCITIDCQNLDPLLVTGTLVKQTI